MAIVVVQDIYNMSLSDLKVLKEYALKKAVLQPDERKKWESFSDQVYWVMLLKTQALFDSCDGIIVKEQESI